MHAYICFVLNPSSQISRFTVYLARYRCRSSLDRWPFSILGAEAAARAVASAVRGARTPRAKIRTVHFTTPHRASLASSHFCALASAWRPEWTVCDCGGAGARAQYRTQRTCRCPCRVHAQGPRGCLGGHRARARTGPGRARARPQAPGARGGHGRGVRERR